MDFEYDSIEISQRYRVERYYLSGGLVGKTCTDCKLVLPVDSYSKSGNVKDGLKSKCTPCRVKINGTYYEENPHIHRKWYSKNGLQNSRDTKARYKRRSYEDVIEDRDRLCPEGDKKCRRCQEDKVFSEFSRCVTTPTGLQDNCMKCNNEKRRIKRKREVETYWKTNNIPLKCYVCEGAYEEYEHVVAKVNYGPDDLQNILPTCVECNRGQSGKHSRSLVKWLESSRPGKVNEVLTRVLSYGVSPWTYLDTPEEISTILTELEQYQTSVL